MKDRLIELLETFGYPVKLQGSLTAEEHYPESFFTFWNNDTEDNAHYDNDPIAFDWSFQVNFYSSNPSLVNSVPLNAVRLLRSNGFIIDGVGYDVPSDEITHTGRGFLALYIERNGG